MAFPWSRYFPIHFTRCRKSQPRKEWNPTYPYLPWSDTPLLPKTHRFIPSHGCTENISNPFYTLQIKSAPKGSPYVENLVQLIRVLQHRDSEHQVTINTLGGKLRESERKRAEDYAKYAEVAVFLEQLKSYRVKLEKVDTLRPACNEFGYSEHTAVTSRFLFIKIIDNNASSCSSFCIFC